MERPKFWTMLFGALLMIIGSQSAYADNSVVNNRINNDFVKWSNETPLEEAKGQFQAFLSTFNTVEDATKWLKAKGFDVPPPRLMNETEGKSAGISQMPAFSLVVGWDAKRNGLIFWGNYRMFFVYSVSIGILYTEPFIIHRISITHNTL